MIKKDIKIKHSDLVDKNPEIYNIINKWYNEINFDNLEIKYSKNWILNDLEAVKQLDKNAKLTSRQKWFIYQNYSTNINNKTIDKYIEYVLKTQDDFSTHSNIYFINGTTNYKEIFYWPGVKKDNINYVKYFYALNSFLEYSKKNQTLLEYIKEDLDYIEYEEVKNNFNYIKKYENTYKLYKYSHNFFSFFNETKNIENILNKFTKEKLLNILNYGAGGDYFGDFRYKDVENWLEVLSNNINIYQKSEINDFLKLLLMKKLTILDRKAQIKNLDSALNMLEVTSTAQKIIYKGMEVYLTQILNFFEENEEKINYQDILVLNEVLLNEGLLIKDKKNIGKAPVIIFELIKLAGIDYIRFLTKAILEETNRNFVKPLPFNKWLSIDDKNLFKLQPQLFFSLQK